MPQHMPALILCDPFLTNLWKRVSFFLYLQHPQIIFQDYSPLLYSGGWVRWSFLVKLVSFLLVGFGLHMRLWNGLSLDSFAFFFLIGKNWFFFIDASCAAERVFLRMFFQGLRLLLVVIEYGLWLFVKFTGLTSRIWSFWILPLFRKIE